MIWVTGGESQQVTPGHTSTESEALLNWTPVTVITKHPPPQNGKPTPSAHPNIPLDTRRCSEIFSLCYIAFTNSDLNITTLLNEISFPDALKYFYLQLSIASFIYREN